MNEDIEKYKIFVGNVPYTCTKKEFISCFKQFDGFVDAEVIKKNDSNTTKGYGFVIFNNQEQMNNVLNSKMITLKNRKLRINKYDPYRNNVNNIYKVFLKNVPCNCTEDEIIKYFSNFGHVVHCYINTKDTTIGIYNSAILSYDSEKSYYNALKNKEVIINSNVIKVFPYQKKFSRHTVRKNNIEASNAYNIGFEAGKLVGYEEGRIIGYKEGLESI